MSFILVRGLTSIFTGRENEGRKGSKPEVPKVQFYEERNATKCLSHPAVLRSLVRFFRRSLVCIFHDLVDIPIVLGF